MQKKRRGNSVSLLGLSDGPNPIEKEKGFFLRKRGKRVLSVKAALPPSPAQCKNEEG